MFFESNPPAYLELLLSESALKKVEGLNVNFAQRLIKKLKSRGGVGISPREDQAFIFLLSWVLLDNQFVRRQSSKTKIPINWVTTICQSTLSNVAK